MGVERCEGPRSVGAETQKKGGWAEGWGARRVGPEGGRPKISRFFFPLSRLHFRGFLSLWGSSLGIVAAVQGRDPTHCARLGSQDRSQMVLKCLYLARILWSVSQLARAVTKWTQACDR